MRKQKNSRGCFLCGLENEFSLRMKWYEDHQSRQVLSRVTVPDHFNGYPGVVHGGIVSAILDETSGRAVMLKSGEDALMVALKLEVTFRRPTPTGIPLTVTGWVIKQTENRAQVAAEIRLPDGTLTAECKAIVVRPPGEIMDKWENEKPYWKVYDD
ncbi:MAG: PaaI family thioesterase [Desulfobacterales bacterium]